MCFVFLMNPSCVHLFPRCCSIFLAVSHAHALRFGCHFCTRYCAFSFPLISILFLDGFLPTILTPGAGGAGVLTGWWAFFVFLVRHKVAGHWRKGPWGKTIKLGAVLPIVVRRTEMPFFRLETSGAVFPLARSSNMPPFLGNPSAS